MGFSNSPDVTQTLSYNESVFIRAERSPTRRAVVYRVARSSPEVWRIRVEKFPEHVNAGQHGWFGGRVLWGHDRTVREDAEAIALAWVADGILPHSS